MWRFAGGPVFAGDLPVCVLCVLQLLRNAKRLPTWVDGVRSLLERVAVREDVEHLACIITCIAAAGQSRAGSCSDNAVALCMSTWQTLKLVACYVLLQVVVLRMPNVSSVGESGGAATAELSDAL